MNFAGQSVVDPSSSSTRNDPSAAILRAIAVSSIWSPSFTQVDRQAAFGVLNELKRYEGRIPLALQWLLTERHVYEGHDISTQTKLLALDLIAAFLRDKKRGIQQFE